MRQYETINIQKESTNFYIKTIIIIIKHKAFLIKK